MTPEVLLKQNDLAGALSDLKKSIVSAPSDAEKRWFLFQLFCFSSEYERAQEQLKLAAQLDDAFQSAFLIYSRIIASEIFRERVVVSAEETPLILGEPEEWMAKLFEANRMLVQKNLEVATNLRQEVYESQKVVAGKCNDVPFEWICDQDSRFAGNLECFLNGKYYWLSLSQIKELSLTTDIKTRSYVDLLYPQAKLTLRTEAEIDIMLFARYPGQYSPESPKLAMNRLTEWDDLNDYNIIGRGQRMLCADSGDFSLLELKTLSFD